MSQGCGPCLDTNCLVCEDPSFCGKCKTSYEIHDGICVKSRGKCSETLLGTGCTYCYSGFYLLNNLCLQACPSGYITLNSYCQLNNTKVIDVDLSNQIKIASVFGFSVGSDNKNESPNFDSNDPIPALNRGYYFASNSYMNMTQFLISPAFSINL